MAGKDLCLLSLDGGGVRGLSSLYILAQIMETIDPQNPPKPCDYFDIIAGTSTGGLLAIMLGRLRMDVNSCIKAYCELSDTVFTKIHHRIAGLSGKVQGRFDSAALESAVKKVMQGQGLGMDALLKDTEGKCKVMLCATSSESRDISHLTSYYSPRQANDLLQVMRIWEAARATSAASTFFDPIKIGPHGEEFIDGATGANNPVRELWTEAQDLWPEIQSYKELKCFISIGTGQPSLKAFGANVIEIARTMVEIATETENTARMFEKEHRTIVRDGRYFRFNVDKGLEEVGLEAAEKRNIIVSRTRLYLKSEHVFSQIQACAASLVSKQPRSKSLAGTTALENINLVTDTSNLRIFIDAGRWPEAVPLQRIEVQRCLSRKGIANDLTLTKMKSLGWLCRRAAFFDEATSILRDAARLANESKLHKLHIRIQVEEAKLKLAQGFYRASEAQCKEILTLQKLHLTPDLYFEVEVAAIILENVVLSGRISKDVVEDILKQYQNCGNLGSGSYPLRDVALAVGKAMARDGCEAAAVKYFKQALEAQELVRPANHPETLLAACLLGFSLTDTGSKEGLELVQSAYVGLEQVIGPKHPWTLLAMHCVGWANIHLGTVDVAVGYLERSFQGSREVLGLSHSQTILTVGVLCHLLLGKGQTTKALKILRPIIAEDSQSLCEDVFNLAAFTNIAGEVFTKSNRKDKARDLYTRFIAEKGNLCQKDFFQLSKMYHALGEICFEEQNYAEAILYFEYAFEGRRNIYGAKGEDTLASMRKLGICYRKNFNEAMAQEFFLHIHTLRTKMLESAENTSGKESPSTLQAVHNLGIAWRDRRHFRSARSTFHRASTGRKKALGATHPLTKESERMEAVSLRDSDPIVRWIKESIFSSGQEY